MAKQSPIVQVSVEPYTKFIRHESLDKKKRKVVHYYDSISLLFHQQDVLKHLDRTDIERMLTVPDSVHREQHLSDSQLVVSCPSRRLQNPSDIKHVMEQTSRASYDFAKQNQKIRDSQKKTETSML